MDIKKFEAVISVIAASLVDAIMSRTGFSEDEAMESLYASELYVSLETEETKVWQYSVPMLYKLYEIEIKNGILDLPEY